MDGPEWYLKFYSGGGRAAGEGAQLHHPRWLQRLIAAALSIGISKRALMEDYYMDEIGAIMEEWNRLHHPEESAETQQVDALSFLGDGGEWIT